MHQLAVGTMVGPYRIDGVLGRGGMATVYLATHESIGRPAALKLLDPQLAARDEFVRRFRREGRVQASLEHPHVVAVFETLETADGLFIAMELVHGSTLATLIAGGSLTAARALELLEQIAAAIDAAHETGLVHRDVKPRNVLVAEGDHAYLADFGLTTLGDETGVTVTGAVLGTVAYLAPEVIRGEPASPASDRYAFAAVAFECLTGSVVFPRPTQAAQLFAHTTEPVPPISLRRPELPAALDAVFQRALAKAPDGRPPSATQLVRSIREAIGDELLAQLGPPAPIRGLEAGTSDSTLSPVVPLPAGVEPPSDSRPPRRRMLLAAAVIVAAVAGAGVGVAAFGGDDDEPPQAVIPPVLPGASVLGSDLEQPGQTRDCRGGPVRPASVGCSILQTRLPEGVLVVPRNGVVRRWAVRSAVGELQLQRLRTRDGESYYQLAFSRTGFVADGQVHAFETDLAVEAGDLLSLHVVSGSGVGLRPTAGATLARWSPKLRGVASKPNSGEQGGELLLRVEYLPGGKQRVPQQIKGAAAARLEPGKVLKRLRPKPPGVRPLDLRLVEVDGAFAVDLFHGDRRLARQTLPDFLAGVGEVVEFSAGVAGGDPNAEVYLEYQRLESTRRVSHYMLAVAREFEFVF